MSVIHSLPKSINMPSIINPDFARLLRKQAKSARRADRLNPIGFNLARRGNPKQISNPTRIGLPNPLKEGPNAKFGINRDAPQYFIISGFIYLPKVAPIITETAVIIMYAQTDPKNTEKGFMDLETMPMLTICVLSAISAKNTAVNVAKNIFQSIYSSGILQSRGGLNLPYY